MKKLITIPLLLFLVVNALTLTRFYTFEKIEHQKDKQIFQLAAIKYKQALENSFQAKCDIVRSLGSFFYSSRFVSRTDFGTFSHTILKHHPEVQAVEWLPYIKHKDRTTYERSVQNEGFEGFSIIERDTNNPQKFIKAGKQTFYAPVHYLEPMQGNERAFGFNLFSNPDRFKAMQRAINTGKITFSSPITLVQEQENQKAILIFMPIFNDQTQAILAKQNQQNLKGFILLILRMDEFLDYVRTTFFLDENINFSLFDISEAIPTLIANKGPTQSIESKEHWLETGGQWVIADRVWKYTASKNLSKIPAHIRRTNSLLIESLIIGLSVGLILAFSSYFRIKSASKKQQDEYKYRKFLTLSSDAFYLSNIDGRFLEVNQQACIDLGYSENELLKLKVHDVQTGFSHEQIDSILEDTPFDQSRIVKGQHQRKDGSSFPVEVNLIKFHYINQDVNLALARDITDRIKNEQTLIEAREAAIQANEAKSEFLANMSHELRTPLHGILSFSRFGLKKVGTVDREKLEKYFSRINQSGERLLLLLNDLLDLAKLESGKIQLNIHQNDLKRIVKTCVAEQEASLKEKNILVKWEDIDFPALADLDRTLIGQVVTNLLNNAIKFSETGKSIFIEILEYDLITTEHQSTPSILCNIRDQGIGIPETELSSVFDKFVQSSKTKTNAGGTGLGLAICHEIIIAHQGKIWAEKGEENGTVFKFVIPLKKPEPADF